MGPILMYLITKSAVLSALEKHEVKLKKNKTDELLTNILIQLGGNPKVYAEMDKPYTLEFE